MAVSFFSLCVLRTASAEALPLALSSFPAEELRDIDCIHGRGGHVDWNAISRRAQHIDRLWQAQFPDKARELCQVFVHDRRETDEYIVLRRAAEALSECALGALTAALVVLVCTSDCSMKSEAVTAAIFDQLWKGVLLGPFAVQLYTLGTSAAWPIASLLAKWRLYCAETHVSAVQGNISHRAKELSRGSELCTKQEVQDFAATVDLATTEQLMPLLWQPDAMASSAEVRLGIFATKLLIPLTTFMNSAAMADPDFQFFCAPATSAQGALLLLFRLLGPPVARDPLNGPRLSELTTIVASQSFLDLTSKTPAAFAAILAASRHLAWRSHHLFFDVPRWEIAKVLHLGFKHASPQACAHDCGLLQAFQKYAGLSMPFWKDVASTKGLQALWRQVSRWLLLGAPRCQGCNQHAPKNPPVYLASAAADQRWVRPFLERALDVRLPRILFVTPRRQWLLSCEDLRDSRQAHATLLCVRFVSHALRPSDGSDKAKFYLLPVLLALGLDVVSLDLDIFLFKDPTSRLLEAVYGSGNGSSDHHSPLDVMATDHFGGACVSTGVLMVRACDRSLLWILRFIEWLHIYPYGHCQNGWDAFLTHSIVEPQIPQNLRGSVDTNVSYGILSTEIEYVTMTGWAGALHTQRHKALLLHFASSGHTTGFTHREMKSQLLSLFNSTARRPGEKEPSVFRVQMATWKALRRLQRTPPRWKTRCYLGVHPRIGELAQTGLYKELFA